MPVYYDEKRKTYYISASYTIKKGVYKKKTVRGFESKRKAQSYEHILMAKLHSEVNKFNNFPSKLDDMWSEYFKYQSLNMWKGRTAGNR